MKENILERDAIYIDIHVHILRLSIIFTEKKKRLAPHAQVRGLLVRAAF